VKRLGILQPIAVLYVPQDSIYRIITGERRYNAAKAAGLKEIPCWVQTPKDEAVLLHQIVENWQRSDMHPFDLADALARLRDASGFSQKDLALHTGKSEGEISKLLSILTLDPAVQKLARDDATGRITKRHLYAVARLQKSTQTEVIQQSLGDGLTAAEVEKLVDSKRKEASMSKKIGAPVKNVRFKTLAATVTVTFRRNTWTDADIAAALDEARAKLGRSEPGDCR